MCILSLPGWNALPDSKPAFDPAHWQNQQKRDDIVIEEVMTCENVAATTHRIGALMRSSTLNAKPAGITLNFSRMRSPGIVPAAGKPFTVTGATMAVGSGARPRRLILATYAPNSKGQKNDFMDTLLPKMTNNFLWSETIKIGAWQNEFSVYWLRDQRTAKRNPRRMWKKTPVELE